MEIGHSQQPSPASENIDRRWPKRDLVFLAFLAVLILAILVAGLVQL